MEDVINSPRGSYAPPHGIKRQLYDDYTDDPPPAYKRRLIDDLASLHVSNEAKEREERAKSRSRSYSPVFGDLDRSGADYEDYYYSDSDKVVINDIDEFLREYPDRPTEGDGVGELGHRIDDFSKVDLEKLVIPELDGQTTNLKEYIAWWLIDKIKTLDEKNGYQLKEKRFYAKLLLRKYLAMLKYYNPKRLMWNIYVRWLREERRARQKHEEPLEDNSAGKIVELDDDGDEEMVMDDMPAEMPTGMPSHIPSGISIYPEDEDEEMSID